MMQKLFATFEILEILSRFTDTSHQDIEILLSALMQYILVFVHALVSCTVVAGR